MKILINYAKATYNVWKKSKKPIAFVKQWLTYGCKYQIMRGHPSKLKPKYSNVYTHQHNPSVFGVLVKKHYFKI